MAREDLPLYTRCEMCGVGGGRVDEAYLKVHATVGWMVTAGREAVLVLHRWWSWDGKGVRRWLRLRQRQKAKAGGNWLNDGRGRETEGKKKPGIEHDWTKLEKHHARHLAHLHWWLLESGGKRDKRVC